MRWFGPHIRHIYDKLQVRSRTEATARYLGGAVADLDSGEAEVKHPTLIRPEEHAVFQPDKMGKTTVFHSERMLVGLNAFEPGQEHRLHAHQGMDKLYYVLEGRGLFLLEGEELAMESGQMLVAPDGVPHGVRNTGAGRLVVVAVLAPGP